MNLKSNYPCPCCGFLVFTEPSGSYEICPVCDWEDDHVQMRFPTMAGGANKKSLWEAQQHLLKQIPVDIKNHEGFVRDHAWRPLRPQECDDASVQPKDGQQYFNKASESSVDYYWLKKN